MDCINFLDSELSTFSFSANNISFESNPSTNSNSTLNETNSMDVSVTNEMLNDVGQQEEPSSNEITPVDATEKAIIEEPSTSKPDTTSTIQPEKSLYKPVIKFSNRNDVEKYIDDLKCFRFKSDK